MTMRWISLLLQRGVLVAIIAMAWLLASARVPSFVLPGPAKVWTALHTIAHSPSFWHDIGTTLGLALGSSKTLARFFEPILAIFNTVSSAIWAIFAILWFGISDATTVFVVFMTAMPLILTNVWKGAQTVDHSYVGLARSFRMSRLQILRKIYLPTILPYFFSGARLAFGFGWRVSLVAETLGSSDGIGYRLRQASDLVQSDQVFAWTALLITMMLVLEAGVLKPLENHLFRWKAEAAH